MTYIYILIIYTHTHTYRYDDDMPRACLPSIWGCKLHKPCQTCHSIDHVLIIYSIYTFTHRIEYSINISISRTSRNAYFFFHLPRFHRRMCSELDGACLPETKYTKVWGLKLTSRKTTRDWNLYKFHSLKILSNWFSNFNWLLQGLRVCAGFGLH